MAEPSLAAAPLALKACTRCKIERGLSDFYKDKRRTDGLSPQCRHCAAHYRKTADPERTKAYFRAYGQANKALIAEKNAKYRAAQKKRSAEYAASYYVANKEHLNAKSRKYNEANRERLTKQKSERYRADPIFRMKMKQRDLLHKVLSRAGVRKNERSHKILGYTGLELKAHIERQFVNGMCWEKMGAEIHIDHIIPIAEFFRAGEFRPEVINALTNLRPMWADENMSKRDKRLHLL